MKSKDFQVTIGGHPLLVDCTLGGDPAIYVVDEPPPGHQDDAVAGTHISGHGPTWGLEIMVRCLRPGTVIIIAHKDDCLQPK